MGMNWHCLSRYDLDGKEYRLCDHKTVLCTSTVQYLCVCVVMGSKIHWCTLSVIERRGIQQKIARIQNVLAFEMRLGEFACGMRLVLYAGNDSQIEQI